MTRELVVSIINYRTGSLTISCVESVLADVGGIDAEVVVVDNASGDGSADLIEDWILENPSPVPVRLIRSSQNTGFSGGHNQSFAAVAADYFLVLNSDALLRPGHLQTLLATAKALPEAGLFAPRLEDEDGTPQVSSFRFHSLLSEFIRAACSGPITRLLRRWDLPLGVNPDRSMIEWASFACILIRGEVIQEIGPMDDGYFLYFEDAEFCLRARRAGWGIEPVPEARAIHLRGGSGPMKSLRKEHKRLPVYYWRSRARFFTQAYGRAGLWAANLIWHAGRGIAQSRRLLGRHVHITVAGEARDIWIGSRSPLAPYRPEESSS